MWAQEMQNLAAEIKTGHKDRTARIGGIKRETRNILGAADDYMKGVAAELKEMARELKDFLAESEEKRAADFQVMIKEVKGVVAQIKKTTKGLLADYKTERKEAAEYWVSLGAKKAAPTSEEKKEEK